MIFYVTGGEHYKRLEFVCETLDKLTFLRPITGIVENGKRGVPFAAAAWADVKGIPWISARRTPFEITNKIGISGIVAFPGADEQLIKEAEKHGVKTWRVPNA